MVADASSSSELSPSTPGQGGVPAGATGDSTPTEERPITLTPSAVEAMKNALEADGEEGDGLRVSVVGGGCSGYQYNLDFEQEERLDDIVIDFGGVNVFIDSVSAGFLKGTTVDYVSSLQGQGFKFVNPNAKRTCGCGSSFS